MKVTLVIKTLAFSTYGKPMMPSNNSNNNSLDKCVLLFVLLLSLSPEKVDVVNTFFFPFI